MNKINVYSKIEKLKKKEVSLGSSIKNKLFYDRSCNPNADEELKYIKTFRKILEDELENPCLSDSQLQSLVEKINKYIIYC